VLTTIIYDSKFGNTEKIAQAIARGASSVGEVRIASVAEADQLLIQRPDLLFVGGPTQRHGMSPGLSAFVENLPAQALAGMAVATFDTRYRQAAWLSGSAAAGAAKRLRAAGGRLVTAPESFFISQAEHRLELQSLDEGELDRAQAWSRSVGATAAATRPESVTV
jgi:flavodoxin